MGKTTNHAELLTITKRWKAYPFQRFLHLKTYPLPKNLAIIHEHIKKVLLVTQRNEVYCPQEVF